MLVKQARPLLTLPVLSRMDSLPLLRGILKAPPVLQLDREPLGGFQIRR